MDSVVRSLVVSVVSVLLMGAAHVESVSLVVSGNITRFTDNIAREYRFSEQELLALPIHKITTTTSWTPLSTFEGPRLSDILEAVGAKGTTVVVHALNDYSFRLPISDAARYGVILAYRQNGEILKRNKFGPLFVIYPRDGHKELQTKSTDAKFVWQVARLVVQ
jgi:hypothetical protein